MMTFRGKRRSRGRCVKNSVVSERQENWQQGYGRKAEDDTIPSLLEKVKSLENELKLKDDRLQLLDKTVKCLDKKVEITNSKCVPVCKEENISDNEPVATNSIEPTIEKLNCSEEELELNNKEIEDIMTKMKYLETEVQLSNDKLNSANEKIKHLEKDLELKNSRYDSIVEEINSLKRQLKLKTSELNATIDENKCFATELEIKNNSLLSTNEKITSLEKENKTKSLEFESMKKKVANLNKQLEQKNKELNLAKDDVKFMKNCYNKAVAKRDRAVNTDAKDSPVFIPKKDKSAQTVGNQFICSSCNESLSISTAQTQTWVTEFPHPVSAVIEDLEVPEGAKEMVPDMWRKTDEAIASDPNYVYIEAMDIYYSPSTGYYYDPETGINTDSVTGTRYVYCPATHTYRLFNLKTISQAILIQHLNAQSENKKRKTSMPRKPSKILKSEENNSDIEEFDSNEEDSNAENGEIMISPMFTENVVISKGMQSIKSLPPSIRCIVLRSETLQKGSLLLVTYTGVTIGRDKNCTMCIPDSNVSKIHARIDFDTSANCYVITDLGSENGTYVNDYRLSVSQEQSEPHYLNHEDCVCIAKCRLLMHIHNGIETCDSCEPGRVRADLIAKLTSRNSEIIILSKEEKEKKRRKELNKLKKRFGLNTAFTEVEKLSEIENLGYKDLAKERQRTKGSDNPYEKTEVQSLDESLTARNKGFRLLQKMGWSEGEGLGKTSSGRVEPVPIPPSVPTTNVKKKSRVMSKAAMRNFQREISLLSGNTKFLPQPEPKMEKSFNPINFVAATSTQISKEVCYASDPLISSTDLISMTFEKQPEVVHESSLTIPPIDFLSKLVEKEPEVKDTVAPIMPPVDFLTKLVEKEPKGDDASTPTLPPSDFLSKLVVKESEVNDVVDHKSNDSKSVEQQPDINDESSSTLPPTDFLSQLVQRKPKKKRRCREMVDGYINASSHS